MTEAEFPEDLKDYIGLLRADFLSVSFCGSPKFDSALHCAVLDKKGL